MTNLVKYQCDKCKNWFSARGGNYKKHINVCEGDYIPPNERLIQCKHCGLDFTGITLSAQGNHTRWCKNNPKRNDYVKKLKKNDNIALMRAAKQKSGKTNQYTKAKIEGTLIPHGPNKGKPGFFSGKKHTEETKTRLREKALASKHRRLVRNIIEYKGVMLDSSWELELAKRLDELNIKWIRPEPIPWTDEDGITHNYFGDFYLIDYDLYLDPKNPQAIKNQRKKLDYLLTQYKNIVILDTLDKCKNFSI